MPSLEELIAKKKGDIQAKKGRQRAYKVGKGKTRVRILPGWRGGDDPTFWHDFGQHFIKDSNGDIAAVYICTENTYGKTCEVCEAIRHGIKHANADETIKQLEEAKSGGSKYLVNALILSDKEKAGEPVVMELGTTVFEAILEMIAEYGDITDLDAGYDLLITREGSGRYDTKYTVMPAPKSDPVPKTMMDKLHNLDEYVAQENEAGKVKALTAVSNVAGVLAGPGSSALLGAPSADYDDDLDAIGTNTPKPSSLADEATDAEYEDVQEAEKATGTDGMAGGVSNDDLDELLDDL